MNLSMTEDSMKRGVFNLETHAPQTIRAIRQRIVFSLLLVMAAFILAASSACSRDPKVQAEKHYARAEKFIHQNNTDAAIIELRSAIQLNPKLAKAHFELANLELQRGAPQIAFGEYVATTRADQKHREAQIIVGEILARAGNFPEAKGQAELILSNWPDEKVGALLLAESSFGLQDYKQARALVEEVLSSDPNNVRALCDLAFLELQEKKVAEGEATLRRAWQLDPKATSAVSSLNNVFELSGDLQNAEAVLKEALAQNPGNASFEMLLANFYMRHQRWADAEPLYRQIQQSSKGEGEYRLTLAEFYMTTNRPKDAETEYQRLLGVNKKDWQSLRGLALAYLADKQYGNAREAVDRLLKNNSKDWQALALNGKLLLATGKPAEAVAELQKSHKANPVSAEVGFDLAQAYIAAGKIDEAQGALEEVLKIDSSYPNAMNTLASIQLSQGHVDQALQDLTKEAESKPNALGTYLLLAEGYIGKGDFAAAERVLNAATLLATTGPAKGAVYQTQAKLKLAQKQYSLAAKLASDSLDNRPRSTGALAVLAESYVAQKQTDLGIATIQARLQQTPDWAQGFEILGSLAQRTGRYSVALSEFNQALNINPKLTSASLGLAETYFQSQQFEQARQQFEKVAAENDSNRSFAMLRIGQIYERKGDFVNARQAYESALAANSANVPAKNNLAWIYAEHGGNIDEALKLAEEAKEQAPNDPGIADTLGWIYVKKGAYQAAIENLKTSAAKDPRNGSYLYHLGTAYYKLGRNDEARKELEAALKAPNFGEAADARNMLDKIAAK
jgi:tetratricopeptide (TPR) repeat protein